MRASTAARREGLGTGDWGRVVCSRLSARERNGILSQKIPCRFQPVSEFVFGTHNAAFVQVMYEDWLRDPTSVAPEWRGGFLNWEKGGGPGVPAKPGPAAPGRAPGNTP